MTEQEIAIPMPEDSVSRVPRTSVLMLGAAPRVIGAATLVGLLWLAVAWAMNAHA